MAYRITIATCSTLWRVHYANTLHYKGYSMNMNSGIQQTKTTGDMSHDFGVLFAMQRMHEKSISQSLSFATDVVMAELTTEMQRLNILVLNILKR